VRPGAVLVGPALPDGNGIDLAGVLSAMPWRPRVVRTSTDPMAAREEGMRRPGACTFVPKDDLLDARLGRLLDGP
jgi:hypothetical protein